MSGSSSGGRSRRLLLALTCVAVSAGIAPAAVSAWGGGCSQSHHCYAVAIWEMSGTEKVEGTQGNEETTAMNVPGWASGDFVDNEEWTIFRPSGYWVEMGQEAGEFMDCCSLHIFYAHENGSGYSQFVAQGTVTGWIKNPYFMRASGNGVWCFYQGPAQEQVSCSGGFPTYSNELNIGAEVAANTKPTNSGSDETNATHLNGGVYPWNKAYGYTDGGMCQSHYTPAPSPGNIYYGTC